MGFVIKAAILTSFFSFMCISNLVPHSITMYDHLKQLGRGDVFFAHPGTLLLLKWSKTIQMRNSVHLLKIPPVGSSPICPVAAIKKLLRLTPKGSSVPLFQIQCRGSWVPLSDTRLRKMFTLILDRLQLKHSSITFHSLRHAGATLAFNSSVPLQSIQSQGT